MKLKPNIMTKEKIQKSIESLDKSIENGRQNNLHLQLLRFLLQCKIDDL
tara:strand:+ start:131 stop:277 length:147 start_codon:yes stop_codon:yes gene_type:complete